MIMITITEWKKKFTYLLVGMFIIVGISICLSATAPSGKLEDDLLNRSIKVQGETGIMP